MLHPQPLSSLYPPKIPTKDHILANANLCNQQGHSRCSCTTYLNTFRNPNDQSPPNHNNPHKPTMAHLKLIHLFLASCGSLSHTTKRPMSNIYPAFHLHWVQWQFDWWCTSLSIAHTGSTSLTSPCHSFHLLIFLLCGNLISFPNFVKIIMFLWRFYPLLLCRTGVILV